MSKQLATDIDFNFISEQEGLCLEGYVPDPEGSRSGVTIASGFDLGQCAERQIMDSFSTVLAEKLLAYVGKKKLEACALIEACPLHISSEEAAEINAYTHATAELRLLEIWRLSSSNVNFDVLPRTCQTVIASVAFQYGNLAIRTPNFWRQVTSGDWDSAVTNLRSFGDNYPSRRNREADILQQWLESLNLG